MIETQLYFSVPRKCYEYTFNCALWRSCQGAITDEADRENKSPQTTGWHGVDKCPPHKQQQTAVFFAAQCERLAGWTRQKAWVSLREGGGAGRRRTEEGKQGFLRDVTAHSRRRLSMDAGTCSGSANLGHSNAQASHTALFGERHFKTIYTYIFHIKAAWEHTTALWRPCMETIRQTPVIYRSARF